MHSIGLLFENAIEWCELSFVQSLYYFLKPHSPKMYIFRSLFQGG